MCARLCASTRLCPCVCCARLCSCGAVLMTPTISWQMLPALVLSSRLGRVQLQLPACLLDSDFQTHSWGVLDLLGSACLILIFGACCGPCSRISACLLDSDYSVCTSMSLQLLSFLPPPPSSLPLLLSPSLFFSSFSCSLFFSLVSSFFLLFFWLALFLSLFVSLVSLFLVLSPLGPPWLLFLSSLLVFPLSSLSLFFSVSFGSLLRGRGWLDTNLCTDRAFQIVFLHCVFPFANLASTASGSGLLGGVHLLHCLPPCY